MGAIYDELPPASESLDGVWSGIVASDAQGLADEVEVLLDSFDNVHRFGPCIWPARGTALPQRGDLCKVMFDEEQRPFIVVWWPNDPTAGTTPGPDSIGTSEIKNGAVLIYL